MFIFAVILNLRFTDFYLEWNSATDVFMFSDTASSRFIRAVGNKIGVQKGEDSINTQ